MTTLEQRLLDYLNDIIGERALLAELPIGKMTNLPLFLRERYHFKCTTLFDRPWILAMAKDEVEIGSAQEYAQHLARIAAAADSVPIILVLFSVPSWTRNRMVQQRVPFIVPGHQMFLPPFTVDLRERAPQARIFIDRPLSPSAQSVFLLQLLKQSLHDVPLRDIASLVGCTPMMITKVKDELAAAGLCDIVKKSRAIVLKFPQDRRALWEAATPRLRSPVRKTHWLHWEQPGYPALAAGLTALSQRTDISDDRLPTWALSAVAFQANLEAGLYRGCRGSEEANVRMESWSYNPMLLGDDKGVDPLSLYLSLRDSPDDRIQQQLERLIDQVPW